MKNIKMLASMLATGLAVASAAAPDPTAPGFIGYAVDDSGLDAVDRHIQPSAATIVSEPPVVAGQAGGPGGHHQVGFNLQAQNSTMMTTVTTSGLLTLTLASGQTTTINGIYAAMSQVVVTESDTTLGATATVTATSLPSMTDADYGTSSATGYGAPSTATGAVSTTTDTAATSSAAATTVIAPSSSSDATATTSSDGDNSSAPDTTSSDPAQSASPTSDNPNAASNCTVTNMLQKFIIFYAMFQIWDMPFFDRAF
ncbi:hypothetical protein PG996_010659 [Apiospora saccharicola]|uniref:Uncharacterized protein n=1 Tax=Apiospora saccharicola TaxID=335842 RepID=A0ABR1UP69_9PEZI